MLTSGKRFSVVLPVRNGGEHLKLCVASILAQTLGDAFDLLILENGSTDGTAQWLAAVADPRVRVYPAERPLSIEENWGRIKDVPRQEFMTAIGHDDLLDPEFLQIIAGLIQEHPPAGLYGTHFRIIDGAGGFVRHCQPMPTRETAADFVAGRLAGARDSFGTGYVLRSATYDTIRGIPLYPKLLYADDALFLQAIGSSYRVTAMDEAFSYRWHTTNTSVLCARKDMFCGLERYGRLLACLGAQDPALAQVLRRYFPAYAGQMGRSWKAEDLLAAYRTHRQADPDLDQRVAELIRSVSGRHELPDSPEPGLLRLLEYANRSKLGGALYEGYDLVQNARKPVAQMLARALRLVKPAKT